MTTTKGLGITRIEENRNIVTVADGNRFKNKQVLDNINLNETNNRTNYFTKIFPTQIQKPFDSVRKPDHILIITGNTSGIEKLKTVQQSEEERPQEETTLTSLIPSTIKEED